MTLDFQPLEYYFKATIKPVTTETEKEPNMFKDKIDYLKEKFISLWSKPTTFQDNSVHSDYEDGYWSFEMCTPAWIDGERNMVEAIHTTLVEPNEATWMETLDKILDAMEVHYGYNIKEQVYYSVNFPLNDPECAGYGRSLNDDLLQQVLLAHPELYLSSFQGAPEGLYA